MQGSTDKQIGFSDLWLEGRIPEDSYWNKIRQWVLNYLTEEIFEPLFSNIGRPSVSPIYTFTAMLIQMEKVYSDAEVEENSRFNDLFKYAITAPRDFEGIDAVTLADHRKRFLENEIGIEIFLNIIEKAKSEGLFDNENISVIDSFMVYGASSRQDTYSMIYQGIKRVLMYCNFSGKKVINILKRNDYESNRKKPEIDWTDNEEKSNLLDALVKDALALVEYLKKENVNSEILEANNLLEKVATQDVKLNDSGNYEMVNGTAKDRIISINDPEMRHGRKTSSKLKDGYKAEIITGGDSSQFVVGFDIDGANTPDGEYFDQLVNEAKERIDVDTVYGDCAYKDYDVIEKYEEENGIEFYIKTPKSINKNGKYTKDEFEIDVDEGTVKCPEGVVINFDKTNIDGENGTVVKFGKDKCDNCSKKDECTNSKNGRTVTINKYEDRYQEDRKIQKTEDFKKVYNKRSNGERTIAFLTRHGGRKARYIGKRKVKFQLYIAAINNNIKQLMKYIFSNNQEIYLNYAQK